MYRSMMERSTNLTVIIALDSAEALCVETARSASKAVFGLMTRPCADVLESLEL